VVGLRRSRESGQAAVESALTIPLFMFVLLGTLQLALMHQARLLTKYAAYKAVRVGAMTSANMKRMERAALAVLLPTIKANHAVYKTTSAGDYASSFPRVMQNLMTEDGQTKYVEIMVCSPNKELLGAGDEHDFDDEAKTGSASARQPGRMEVPGWKEFDRGRLSIQVTYNYRMIIPFADMMLYRIFMGQDRADLLWTFRMSPLDPQVQQQQQLANKYDNLANAGQYVYPIRANYLMRMQSSLFPGAEGHELPQKNECVLRFPKDGEGSTAPGTGVVEDGVDDDTEPEPPE
jgi:hypothetical protein